MADDAAQYPIGADALISGRFALLEELGQGSSGTVYRARLEREIADLPTGTEVAVKFLRRELLSDPEAQARLEAEGRFGRRIQSDQVVRIHAVESLRVLGLTATYLIMELVSGRSLREVLRDSGSVVEELARRIGQDAAKGLRAVHELGLVHRDVKPENLALTDEGAVKVMDLGLVRRIKRRDADAKSGFYGSLSYAAPEVLRGQPATPKSDLYSLGVVLFEVVTGRHPFATAETQPDEIIAAHLEQSPPRPSHEKPRISAFLEQLILDLLAKDPADRPRNAADLAVILERGETSRYWIRHEREAPRLASRRRLRAMRRNAAVALVGRKRERRELDNLLRSAMDGRGQAVLVTGPGSIGRRRLLDEWLDDWLARRDDLVFLGGNAKAGAGVQRAAPFTDILNDWFLRGDRPDSPNARTRLAARIAAESHLDDTESDHLATILADEDNPLSPEERADLIARQILAIRPRGQTIVLRVDQGEDLSTTASLVVHRLLAELDAHRVLLLIVALDGKKPLAGMRELHVPGLSLPDFLTLGSRLFADRAMPRELLETAHESLAGNPGNLIDALALLARERKLDGRAGSYRLLAEVTDLRPARSLLERLRQRVALLSPAERFVHLAAAVLGPTFPLGDLAALVGQSELAVLEALSVFDGRVILTHRGSGRFRHRDFRKELLKIAPPNAKRRLHRMAAWTLEDRGAPALDIGLHLSRAAEHAAAVPWLLDALEQLIDSGSRQSSVKVRNRLRIHLAATSLEDAERCRFAWLSGRVAETQGKFDRARADYEAAIALGTTLDDPRPAARARFALAHLELELGQLPAALGTVEAANAALPRNPDVLAFRAQGLALRARALGYLGRSDEALQDVRRALGVLPEDDELLPHLHTDLARLEALRNHFVAALKSFERAAALFDAAGSRPGRMRVDLHMGHALAAIGNRRQAEARLHDALALAEQLANPRAEAKAHLFLGEQRVWHDEPTTARAHLHRAMDVATQAGDHVTAVAAGLYLATLGVPTADLEERVETLGLPALRVHWRLVQGTGTALAEATAIDRDVTLPLHLHRRLLNATGRENTARHLEREIADRLPAGQVRRRFLAFVR